MAIPEAKAHFPDLPAEYCEDVEALAEGCDALVVATDWRDYRHLPLREMAARMKGTFVLDARNLLAPEEVRRHGLTYEGVGR